MQGDVTSLLLYGGTMKITIISNLFFLLLVIGCSSPPIMNPDIKYQRDLKFDVEYWTAKTQKWSEPKSFVGVGVLKDADWYQITIHAVGKVDMMVLSSCHREVKTPNPEKHGGWFNKRNYKFKFAADDLIEKGKPCMLNGGVYEKKKGRHGWLMGAIEDPKATMKAKTRCNGLVLTNKGTSFCQAKEGLIQRLEFENPVDTTFYGDCRIRRPADGKNWEYLMPRGKCILHFFDEDLNEHVHYMFGYDTIPIRGVE